MGQFSSERGEPFIPNYTDSVAEEGRLPAEQTHVCKFCGALNLRLIRHVGLFEDGELIDVDEEEVECWQCGSDEVKGSTGH